MRSIVVKLSWQTTYFTIFVVQQLLIIVYLSGNIGKGNFKMVLICHQITCSTDFKYNLLGLCKGAITRDFVMHS